jgi:uncharacterized protein YndB with AHSA1/START domain
MTESWAGLTLHQERTLPAPPERVFAALTEAADLARWWGPHGFTTSEIDLDLRVGGRYRFTMQPPEGETFHLSGEYLVVEPPRRLSFTFRWDEPDPDDRETVVALVLEPAAEGTTASLTQGEFATEARLELHRAGWTDSLDKLATMLRASSA